MTYDLIIVGAGAAGLRVGIETLKKQPALRCCILEKYGYIGGRIVTYRKNVPGVGQVQWENGAGRISTSHKKVLQLFTQYGLTFVPIGDEMDFVSADTHLRTLRKDRFNELLPFYLGPIASLPAETLRTDTLGGLLEKTLGSSKAAEFYEQFPYYSEIHDLRADVALKSFGAEMGTNKGFGVCKEGLSALAHAMAKEFISLGGTILFDTDVGGVSKKTDGSIIVLTRVKGRPVEHIGAACVLALHHTALLEIQGVKQLPLLRHLQMTPLLRMYAVFPVQNGQSWFLNLPKIVTDSRIRYIIPIDSRRGIVMISYTDGQDAAWWMKQKGGQVKELVMSEIRSLFPDREIPDPLFFKQHPWTSGCTYWLPGNYDVVEQSEKSLQPLPNSMPNLFMCGESFAIRQCWIESALEQADTLLALPAYRKSLA